MSNRRKLRQRGSQGGLSGSREPTGFSLLDREFAFVMRLLELQRYRDAEFASVRRRVAREVLGNRRAAIQGEEAAIAMQQATQLAANMATALADQRDAFHWLERLRLVPLRMYGAGGDFRVDSYFEGQILTEALSARTRRSPPTVSERLTDPLDDDNEALVELVRLLAIGSVVRHYKVMWRCAAKNVPVVLRPDRLAVPDKGTPEWAAIELYDQRRLNEDSFGVAVGTMMPRLPLGSAEPRSASTLLGIARDPSTDSLLHMTYRPWLRHYSLPALLKGYEWYRHDLPVLIFLNQVLMHPYVAGGHGRRQLIERLGYSVWERRTLADLLKQEAAMPAWREGLAENFVGFEPSERLDVQQLLGVLASPGQVMPLRPGPVLRQIDREKVSIDHSALDYRLALAVGPTSARDEVAKNTRASDFETKVQELIDSSQWAPPPPLRVAVGGNPKDSSGRVITDLDAIAAKGDTCLLINCKSFLPDLLDEGDHKAIRSVYTQLQVGVQSWRQKVQRVLTDATGARYEPIRSYSKVLPVIVTPGSYFMPLDLASDMASPDLRAVVSVLELASFMRIEP